MIFFKKIQIKEKFIYPFALSVFSILINQFYGYVGILPIDSFLVFNSGYDFLNGYYPFKDYWTIKEPFIDFLQASFFKFFGVSWFVYVFHASFFNFIISIFTYHTLRYFNLSILLSFFYSCCVAILTYPTAGTPFSDHHTLIFCVLAIYLFCITIITNKSLYWFLLPLLLGVSFLSKQAPTSYLIIIISFLSMIYFIYKKNFNGLFFSILGIFTFISSFLILIFLFDIDFKDFLNQYILFPKTLGASRLDWVFPLEFKRFFLRFKLHYLSILILILSFLSFFKVSKRRISFEDALVLITLIASCLMFIFHQLMTINAIYIYCLIPIYIAFSNIYSNKLYKNANIAKILIVFALISTSYYYFKYVHSRTFMDLNYANLKNSIDAKEIDLKLKNIKWITVFYPETPDKEIKNIKFALDILKKDREKKMIITDYQFISILLQEYDYSVTRFWYDYHGYPSKENKYFKYWKKFVIKKIKQNNIKNIYVLKPLHGEEKPLENIFENCLKKRYFNEVFYLIDIKKCDY